MEAISSISGFSNFDQKDHFEQLESAVLKETTLNFAIEFDGETAYAATDLDVETLKKYLAATRTQNESTRWINIFAPDMQPEFVKLIAKYYNFSPRLAGLMYSKQDTPKPVGSVKRNSRWHMNSHLRSNKHEHRSAEIQLSDPEKNTAGTGPMTEAPMLDLNHYKLVNEVWHYNSVDWASQYLCIGYNSLPNINMAPDDNLDHDEMKMESDQSELMQEANSTKHPMGKRVWNWLILCDDGTVISIQEDPFPSSRNKWSLMEKENVKVIRRNLLSVVRQLSNEKNEWRKLNPIQTLDIRPGMQSNLNSKVTLLDSPGLLFYYLFDDWFTTYALVAKKEQQYASRLEQLRNNMFQRPDIALIKSLHQTGRQLAVLKRMYQSYALIISRILEKQKPSTDFTARQAKDRVAALRPPDYDNNVNPQGKEDSMNLGGGHIMSASQTFGALLPQVAIVRFERLLDRINLYALCEIQDCLDEKEALVFLNFNLITLKESYSIEKLTRITIILAKATILFLPVSLMTAYFSTQIQDLQGIYTATTYWVCFAIIISLSFMFLFGFGWISDTLEGKVIYRSTTRTLFEAGKQAYRLSRLGRKKSD